MLLVFIKNVTGTCPQNELQANVLQAPRVVIIYIYSEKWMFQRQTFAESVGAVCPGTNTDCILQDYMSN